LGKNTIFQDTLMQVRLQAVDLGDGEEVYCNYFRVLSFGEACYTACTVFFRAPMFTKVAKAGFPGNTALAKRRKLTPENLRYCEKKQSSFLVNPFLFIA
jgi:hypothetical protein